MRSKKALFWTTGSALAVGASMIRLGGPEAVAAPSPSKAKPEVVELGRRLFMDPTVSRLGRHSCAECHDPEQGFTDPRKQSADDAGPTKRHSQPLIDLAGEGFHWDGQFKTVRQLLVARVAPAEMANKQARDLAGERRAIAARAGEDATDDDPPPVPGTQEQQSSPTSDGYGFVPTSFETPITPVADRLREDGRYAEAFKAAFGGDVPTIERVLDAMDAYCASIRSTTNAFDRFMAGDEAALSASAQRGLALFHGKAACSTCHVTDATKGRAPFTDGKFHDTGVAYHLDYLWRNGLDGGDPKDMGRRDMTSLKADLATFKTPTLRDVALRGPYMHDASFATLTDVVKYYNEGGTRNPNLDPAIKKLDLTDAEVKDVVAFLESLTGEKRAGLGMPSRRSAPLRVRVEDLGGKALSGFTISVSPYGDRLVGAETTSAAARVTTNDRGEATIVRPLTTHVALSSPDYQLGLSRPIPDSCESQTLIATPRDVMSLRVRRTSDGPELPATIEVRQAPTRAQNAGGMAGCGAPGQGGVVVTLVKMRMLGQDEALYAGQAGAVEGLTRCALSIGGDRRVVCDLALGGGASETILLGRAPKR